MMSCILVVDDDRYMAEAAAIMMMYDPGHSTVTAFNGYDALAKMRSRAIDLVITDLKMPGLDGFSLIRSMRQNGIHIPVIIVTAFHVPEERKRAEQLNVFAYLTRPFDNEELRDLVSKALEHHAALEH